jgi:hypothetical protein
MWLFSFRISSHRPRLLAPLCPSARGAGSSSPLRPLLLPLPCLGRPATSALAFLAAFFPRVPAAPVCGRARLIRHAAAPLHRTAAAPPRRALAAPASVPVPSRCRPGQATLHSHASSRPAVMMEFGCLSLLHSLAAPAAGSAGACGGAARWLRARRGAGLGARWRTPDFSPAWLSAQRGRPSPRSAPLLGPQTGRPSATGAIGAPRRRSSRRRATRPACCWRRARSRARRPRRRRRRPRRPRRPLKHAWISPTSRAQARRRVPRRPAGASSTASRARSRPRRRSRCSRQAPCRGLLRPTTASCTR